MTSTAVEHVDPGRRLPAGAAPKELSFDELMRRCEVLAKTELVPKSLQNRPQAIALVGMYGAELGVPLTTSTQQIDVIENRPDPCAQLRIALIRREGHQVRWGVNNDQRAVISGRRKEYANDPDGWVTVEWTIDQARRAGLTDRWVERKYKNQGDRYDRTERFIVGDDRGIFTEEERRRLGLPVEVPPWAQALIDAGKIKFKDNWQKYPADMLRARASKALSRMEFSDVLAALNVPDGDHDSPLDLDEDAPRVDREDDDEPVEPEVQWRDDEDDVPEPDEVVVEPEDQGPGRGEPEGDPQPPKQAPSAGDTWPPDLPPEAEPVDDAVVDENWVKRFDGACRNAGLNDDERAALIHQGTAGRVRVTDQVRTSEIPVLREWFDRVTAADPDYVFRDVQGSVVIGPRSPEGTEAGQLPLAGGEAA